jgi:hypothetical protein
MEGSGNICVSLVLAGTDERQPGATVQDNRTE